MESNILVGGIVGLITATSLYVWNSDNFTKPQKTFLLLAIVFFPIQWLGIIIILIYNNYRDENTPDKLIEKKINQTNINLNSSISNLLELKDKGIITESEYNLKISKIEVEKSKYLIKNSIEYKQLQNLLENNILTKEEFNSKIKILENIENKESEIDIIISSVKELEIQEEIKFKEDYNKIEEKVKKGNSTSIYIFSFIFFVIIIAITVIINFDKINSTYNYENSESPSAAAEITPEIIDSAATADETTNSQYQNTTNFKKFAYVIIKIKTPKLKTSTLNGLYDANTGFYSPTKYLCYVVWEDKEFITDIFEIENFNEDAKYMFLDKSEKQIKEKYYYLDSNFSMSITNECKDYDEREQITKENYKTKIVDRQIYTFDSYSEASINKSNQ